MMRTLLLSSIVLTGCASMDHAYQLPDAEIAETDTFVAASAAGTMPTEADLYWWRHFNDPLLTQWVERALTGNLDVAIAAERVQQAQALLRSAQAERGPVLGGRVQAGASERRISGGSSNQGSGSAGNVSAGLSFDWTIDLWGGLRQAEQSAAASLLQRQDLVQAARLATAGLTARSYITWRAAQQEHALLRETLHVWEETLRIVQIRVDAGLAPPLDVARAQADLAAVRANLDDTASSIRQAEMALQMLAGVRPSPARLPVSPATEQSIDIPRLAGPPFVPRPIDLLRLRPDVRAAQRALIAASADIGVAQAAIYPQLRLPGELLLSATGLGTDVIVRTLTTSLSALLQVSLFDGGQRAAAVDAAQSRAREAALTYRKTVLEALEQAETALLAHNTTRSQQQARLAAAEASATALRQARVMYTEGLTGLLDVLDIQRNWLTNRMELLRTEADAARATIAIFEATGLIAAPLAVAENTGSASGESELVK